MVLAVELAKKLRNQGEKMNADWGLWPVLFEIGDFKIEAYPVFVTFAILIGLGLYLFQLRKDQVKSSNALYIVLFALVGGAIGAKVPIFIIYWKELSQTNVSMDILLSGRSIVGGLIGGFLFTLLSKRLFNIKDKMGNQIAIPVAFSMAIGRFACLFRGCCYGQPTGNNYGIDFGDGIHRHPTQIYEMIFDFLLALYLIYRKKKGVSPGELFMIFMNYYLGFRFLNEFIRVEHVTKLGLTDFQLICILSLLYINRKFIIKLFNKKETTINE